MLTLNQEKKTSTKQSLSVFNPPENRAVFKISSVNFGFKSQDDKTMYTESFGKLLNSLNFPIQILCESNILKAEDWLLKDQDEEYQQFLVDTIKSKNVTEKKFYIAFNANDKTELNMLKNNMIKHIKRCNLTCEETEPERETHKIEVPKISPNYVKVGDEYCATLIVNNWPYAASLGWLEDLYNLDKNISLSMFVHPVAKDEAVKYLGRQIARFGSTAAIKDEEGSYDGSEDEDIVSAVNMRNELNKNEGRFMFVSYYITVKSKSLPELKRDLKYVKTILSGMMIETKSAILRQDDAYKCSLPHGIDYLKNKAMYTFTTTPLKRFFPFISANIVDIHGILMGENLLNNSLVFLDPFRYETATTIVMGKPGSGKSYTIKAKIDKLVKQGIEVTAFDIENEFSRMQKHKNLHIKHFGMKMNDQYKKALFDYWDEVNANPNKPRFLVIDEFWWYMKDPEVAELIQKIAKLGRKRWLGLCVITQEVNDMLKSEYAESIINSASIKIILKIEPNQKELISKTFGLTGSELSFLIGAVEGEGILFAGSNHVQFRTITSPEQHRRITTKPQELHSA